MRFVSRSLRGARAIAFFAFAASIGVAGPAAAQVTAFKQAVAETAAKYDDVAAFYRETKFEPIWTGPDADDAARRSALINAMGNVEVYGLPKRRFDPQALVAKMRNARTARELGALEVELSHAFIGLARALQNGVLTPGRIDPGLVRAVPYRDSTEQLRQIASTDPKTVFHSLVPQSPEYSRLLKAKMQLEHQLTLGGWGATVPASTLKPGQSGSAVVALRDRMIRMGYLHRSATAVYDAPLQAAVQRFQLDHGLETDGVAGGQTMSEINVDMEKRLQQVLVALERERWLNFEGGLGKRHVKVNLTDFKAWIIDDNKVTFETRAVVGMNQSDRRTPEFSDEMERVVINPSWYVPRSIIVNEYLPALQNNPNAAGHLEITDARGRVVNRGNGFDQYSASSFPFAMRQPPGPRNALGVVKFLFPNKYNIYLHDTPEKALFNRERRAYSHGCIRLHKPREFAYEILSRQEADPEGYFNRILNTGVETNIELEQHVPVHLIYRTAYTDVKGQLQFRDDVYGRDAAIWNALSAEGVTAGGVQG